MKVEALDWTLKPGLGVLWNVQIRCRYDDYDAIRNSDFEFALSMDSLANLLLTYYDGSMRQVLKKYPADHPNVYIPAAGLKLLHDVIEYGMITFRIHWEIVWGHSDLQVITPPKDVVVYYNKALCARMHERLTGALELRRARAMNVMSLRGRGIGTG